MRVKMLTVITVMIVMTCCSKPAEARPDELLGLLFGQPYPAVADVQGDVPTFCRVGEASTDAMGMRRVYQLSAGCVKELPAFCRVCEGDTLWDIAWRYGVGPDAIAQANDLSPCGFIFPGQYLAVPAGCLVHTIGIGDTLWGVALRYGVAPEDIVRANGLDVAVPPALGTELIIPVPSIGEVMLPDRGNCGVFGWPVQGPISSGFGMRDGRPHEGVDIAAGFNTPIEAAAGGRVTYAGPAGTYGLLVIVTHADGWSTYYAHCDRIDVVEGQDVAAGEVISVVGSTGHSTGPHLHFEVRQNGVPMDPATVLRRE